MPTNSRWFSIICFGLGFFGFSVISNLFVGFLAGFWGFVVALSAAIIEREEVA